MQFDYVNYELSKLGDYSACMVLIAEFQILQFCRNVFQHPRSVSTGFTSIGQAFQSLKRDWI